MKNFIISVLLLTVLFAFSACMKEHKYADLPTVNSVDLKKYLGIWHEVANIPNHFQKRCVKDTTAEYAISSIPGLISVKNSCVMANGKVKIANGNAKVVDEVTNAKLKVSFFPFFKSHLFFAGKYWILDIDRNYQYVMVGHPNRRFLWILSRSPFLKEDIYDTLIEKANNLGFDTSKIVKNPA